MDNTLKIYRKHNSFVGIRHKVRNSTPVLIRIQKVREDIEQYAIPLRNREIIVRACDELLAESDGVSPSAFRLSDNVVEEISRLDDDLLPRYLFYRYRYEVFPHTYQRDDFPPCLQLEVTSICNYRCVFCYQSNEKFTRKETGHMGMMTLDMFKQVIDQAEGQCEALTISSRGEPLICRDIVPMLEYCRGKFLAMKINTNAWFLDEEKSHALLQAGLNTLVFSADATSEPLYSKLRVNGQLDRVVKNIRQFKEIRDRFYPDSRLITRVSGVYMNQGQDLDEMERFWGELADQVAFVEYNPWEDSYEHPLNTIQTHCSDLWRRMFVWFDGTVNPCDVDYMSTMALGNVRDLSLSDIWTSEKYERLRKTHLSGRRTELSPCNLCTLI